MSMLDSKSVANSTSPHNNPKTSSYRTCKDISRCSRGAMISSTILVLSVVALLICVAFDFFDQNSLFGNRSAAPIAKTTESIVGGKVIPHRMFPYVVQIRYAMGHSNLCGAALIEDNVILTASHCVQPRIINRFRLEVAVYHKNAPDNVQVYKIESVHRHPKWKLSTRHVHDIALVKLKNRRGSKGSFARNYNAHMCLDLTNDDHVGMKVVLAGWGRLDKVRGKRPRHLHYVQERVLDTSVCKRKYEIFRDICILCVDGVRPKTGQCSGDSGGPLFGFDEKKRPMQIGIVGFSKKAGRDYKCARNPGGFTRVSCHSDWIVSKVKRISKNRRLCVCDSNGCSVQDISNW